MENQKQVSRFLLYIGAGLSVLSLIGLASAQSARRSGSFGDIVSVSDCQISFLQGGAGCNDSQSTSVNQDALWQAGLAIGIIALAVATWLNWASNNRPAAQQPKVAKVKSTTRAKEPTDIKSKLLALEELREEKLISSAEFHKRRKKLLEDL
jgi:hypothetical protein